MKVQIYWRLIWRQAAVTPMLLRVYILFFLIMHARSTLIAPMVITSSHPLPACPCALHGGSPIPQSTPTI